MTEQYTRPIHEDEEIRQAIHRAHRVIDFLYESADGLPNDQRILVLLCTMEELAHRVFSDTAACRRKEARKSLLASFALGWKD